MKLLLLLASILSLCVSSFAQVPTRISTDTRIKVFESKSDSKPPVVRLPKLDISTYIKEDEEEQKRGLGYPPRFGKDIDVNYSLSNSGKWEDMGDGKLWKLEIASEGALSLNIILDKFFISEGSELYI